MGGNHVEKGMQEEKEYLDVEVLITWISLSSELQTWSDIKTKHTEQRWRMIGTLYMLAQWMWGQVYLFGCNLQPHS